MKRENVERELRLPAGFHKETGQLVTLGEVRDDLDALRDLDSLKPEQELQLIVARCRAGGWNDMMHGTEGYIDLERGVREMTAGTEVGKQLFSIYKGALEMVLEDARGGKLNVTPRG